VKALILIVLIVAVFGSAAYWTYELFLRPQQELKEDKRLPPAPPPPDPALPEFQKCVSLQKERKLLEARSALEQFIDHNPQSSKVEEAKDRLGEINTDIFFTNIQAPEKQIYLVKSGDVLNRVAQRLKTTPELITRENNLTGTMLRIGQKLMVTPVEFSVVLSKRAMKMSLYNRGKFFKQYPIRSLPPQQAAAKKTTPAAVQRVVGKVTEKMAWSQDGKRVIFSDKEYAGAAHWIVFSIPGNTLYSAPDEGSRQKVNKPPTGIGLAPEHMEELAVLLSKGNPVTIEQ
jgi:LysM repeat protein